MTGWTSVAAGLAVTALTLAWYSWWSRPRPASPGRRPDRRRDRRRDRRTDERWR